MGRSTLVQRILGTIFLKRFLVEVDGEDMRILGCGENKGGETPKVKTTVIDAQIDIVQ